MKDIIKKSRGMSRRRLQHVYDLARTKTECDGGGGQKKLDDPFSGDADVLKQTV